MQLAALGLFHHEDQLRPFDQLGAERLLGVVIEPGRGYFQIVAAAEHLLGGRAAQLVLAAHEQDALHARLRRSRRIRRG
ncbi:hypothetical protein KME82_04550 [Lysobacter capsici]|nr:hypothetical protein [Lysobacter capsici]QWF18047.1 hypothetical protein KME82_04550 [Lysobacter capsici]